MESFEVRKRALFECLSQAEDSLKGTKLDQSNKRVHEKDIEGYDKSSSCKITRLRGKESIFVKPDQPITKCLKPRRQPDYQVNPHKWTKYSLEDADISDRTNTDAAFTFLREIAEQKQAQEESEEDLNEDGKIVFHKPIRSKQRTSIDTGPESEKPEMKGSKVVMPEYVIGQRPAKAKKSTPNKSTDKGKSQAVKLDHLFDE